MAIVSILPDLAGPESLLDPNRNVALAKIQSIALSQSRFGSSVGTMINKNQQRSNSVSALPNVSNTSLDSRKGILIIPSEWLSQCC